MSMRILHVVPQGSHGDASSSFTIRQIEGLKKAGVAGQLIFFRGAEMLLHPHQLPSQIAMIRREIKDFQPDIVHAHWGSLLAFSTALASIGGPPLVISYRGSDINPVPSEVRLRGIIRITCSQLAAIRASAIICVSEELRGRLWLRHKSVNVILDGTDLSLFHPIDKLDARRQLKWPSNEPVIFFYEGERPDTKRRDLVDASFKEIRKVLHQCRLEVMGSDVPRNRVPLLLNASDCLLMTSDFEGSPNIVREALACNTPVVSVDVGDIRRWLMNLDGTRIVSRDPMEISKNVVDLISTGIRPSIGSRALQFSDEMSTNAVLSVYRQVLLGSSQDTQ